MEKETTELQLRERSTGLIATIKNPESLREMERTLTLQKIVDSAIPIAALRHTVSSKEIAQALDIQLTRLVGSLNLKYNLKDEQIKIIVEDLLDKYPNESLEDFVLVFKKARTGSFKDEEGNATIYRLDSAVIFGWMEKHLEEKYRALEDKLRDEKDDLYKPVKPIAKSEQHQEWLDKLKKAIEPIDAKKPAPLTTQNILEEGQEKPKSVAGVYAPDYEAIKRIELQSMIHEISREGYGHLKPIEKKDFTLFDIEGFKVFAANKEDAETIYKEAKKREYEHKSNN